MIDILRLAFVVSLVSIAGCHHGRRGYEWMSTAGYRYRAGAAVVGPAGDTLRVAVVVVNESNQARELTFYYCPPYAHALKARVAAAGRNWSSEVYEDKQHLTPGHSTGMTMMACTGNLEMMRFPAGAHYTSVLKVPVNEILGDSLPAGRYNVTARLVGNGGDGRKLDAGEVVLR